MTFKTIKKIKDKLWVTHEGTKEVKQSKINILLYDYDLFCMLPHEFISNMYIYFTKIVTSLYALGMELTNAEKINKILCYLSEFWDAKITTISKTKDLFIYSHDNLFGSLIAYEQKS